MIKILKEELDNSVTDETLENAFDTQKERVAQLVDSQADVLIAKINKLREPLKLSILKDYIGSINIDNFGYFNLISSKDVDKDADYAEYRQEQIQDLNNIIKETDDSLLHYINQEFTDNLQ